MASEGDAEIHEGGEWLAQLAAFRWEIRQDGKNSLLHLWSDECNYTRRLLDVKEQSADRIILEIQRFGRAKPGRLEVVRPASPRVPTRIAREKFHLSLRRILAEAFPDAEIQPLSVVADLKNSFSGVYVRGAMKERRRGRASRTAR